MLNFLRKLRKKENRTSQYMKYAIGEILLVVVGILIALSIDNANEQYKNKQKAKLTLEILKEEVNENLRLLQEDFTDNTELLDSLNIYLNSNLVKERDIDKAVFISRLLNYNWDILNYPTVEQELGPVRVVQFNPELNALLKELKSAHSAYNFQLNYLNELFNNKTVPFLLEAGAGTGLINSMFFYGEEVDKLAALYNTEPLNNILSIQQLFLISYNNRIARLMEESETVLEYLSGFE